MSCPSIDMNVEKIGPSASPAPSAVNDFVPRERNRKLRRLIERELEALKLNKEIYDSAHPNQSKNFSADELWRIARTKVLQKLCKPENGMGSE
jgi:hypothetical protein